MVNGGSDKQRESLDLDKLGGVIAELRAAESGFDADIDNDYLEGILERASEIASEEKNQDMLTKVESAKGAVGYAMTADKQGLVRIADKLTEILGYLSQNVEPRAPVEPVEPVEPDVQEPSLVDDLERLITTFTDGWDVNIDSFHGVLTIAGSVAGGMGDEAMRQRINEIRRMYVDYLDPNGTQDLGGVISGLREISDYFRGEGEAPRAPVEPVEPVEPAVPTGSELVVPPDVDLDLSEVSRLKHLLKMEIGGVESIDDEIDVSAIKSAAAALVRANPARAEEPELQHVWYIAEVEDFGAQDEARIYRYVRGLRVLEEAFGTPEEEPQLKKPETRVDFTALRKIVDGFKQFVGKEGPVEIDGERYASPYDFLQKFLYDSPVVLRGERYDDLKDAIGGENNGSEFLTYLVDMAFREICDDVWRGKEWQELESIWFELQRQNVDYKIVARGGVDDVPLLIKSHSEDEPAVIWVSDLVKYVIDAGEIFNLAYEESSDSREEIYESAKRLEEFLGEVHREEGGFTTREVADVKRSEQIMQSMDDKFMEKFLSDPGELARFVDALGEGNYVELLRMLDVAVMEAPELKLFALAHVADLVSRRGSEIMDGLSDEEQKRKLREFLDRFMDGLDLEMTISGVSEAERWVHVVPVDGVLYWDDSRRGNTSVAGTPIVLDPENPLPILQLTPSEINRYERCRRDLGAEDERRANHRKLEKQAEVMRALIAERIDVLTEEGVRELDPDDLERARTMAASEVLEGLVDVDDDKKFKLLAGALRVRPAKEEVVLHKVANIILNTVFQARGRYQTPGTKVKVRDFEGKYGGVLEGVNGIVDGLLASDEFGDDRRQLVDDLIKAIEARGGELYLRAVMLLPAGWHESQFAQVLSVLKYYQELDRNVEVFNVRLGVNGCEKIEGSETGGEEAERFFEIDTANYNDVMMILRRNRLRLPVSLADRLAVKDEAGFAEEAREPLLHICENFKVFQGKSYVEAKADYQHEDFDVVFALYKLLTDAGFKDWPLLYKYLKYVEEDEVDVPIVNFMEGDAQEEMEVQVVDVEEKMLKIARRLAEEKYEEEMGEMTKGTRWGPGKWKVLPKLWKGKFWKSYGYSLSRQGWIDKYEQEFLEELREKPDFFKKKMGELGADSGDLGSHDAEVAAIVNRFEMGNTTEEEVVAEFRDQAFMDGLHDLARSYLVGAVDDAAFKAQSTRLISQIRVEHVSDLADADEKLVATNLTEKMKDLREKHMKGLANIDVENFRLTLKFGKALNVDVHSAADDATWGDRMVRWLQRRTPESTIARGLINPTTVGIGAFAAANFLGQVFSGKSARYALGGGLGVLLAPTIGPAAVAVGAGVIAGGALAAKHRDRHVIMQEAQKNRREALGIYVQEPDGSFEKRLSAATSEKRAAMDMARELVAAREEGRYQDAFDLVAEIETRDEMSMEERRERRGRRVDLISFSDQAHVETERMALLGAAAQAKEILEEELYGGDEDEMRMELFNAKNRVRNNIDLGLAQRYRAFRRVRFGEAARSFSVGAILGGGFSMLGVAGSKILGTGADVDYGAARDVAEFARAEDLNPNKINFEADGTLTEGTVDYLEANGYSINGYGMAPSPDLDYQGGYSVKAVPLQGGGTVNIEMPDAVAIPGRVPQEWVDSLAQVGGGEAIGFTGENMTPGQLAARLLAENVITTEEVSQVVDNGALAAGAESFLADKGITVAATGEVAAPVGGGVGVVEAPVVGGVEAPTVGGAGWGVFETGNHWNNGTPTVFEGHEQNLWFADSADGKVVYDVSRMLEGQGPTDMAGNVLNVQEALNGGKLSLYAAARDAAGNLQHFKIPIAADGTATVPAGLSPFFDTSGDTPKFLGEYVMCAQDDNGLLRSIAAATGERGVAGVAPPVVEEGGGGVVPPPVGGGGGGEPLYSVDGRAAAHLVYRLDASMPGEGGQAWYSFTKEGNVYVSPPLVVGLPTALRKIGRDQAGLLRNEIGAVLLNSDGEPLEIDGELSDMIYPDDAGVRFGAWSEWDWGDTELLSDDEMGGLPGRRPRTEPPGPEGPDDGSGPGPDVDLGPEGGPGLPDVPPSGGEGVVDVRLSPEEVEAEERRRRTPAGPHMVGGPDLRPDVDGVLPPRDEEDAFVAEPPDDDERVDFDEEDEFGFVSPDRGLPRDGVDEASVDEPSDSGFEWAGVGDASPAVELPEDDWVDPYKAPASVPSAVDLPEDDGLIAPDGADLPDPGDLGFDDAFEVPAPLAAPPPPVVKPAKKPAPKPAAAVPPPVKAEPAEASVGEPTKELEKFEDLPEAMQQILRRAKKNVEIKDGGVWIDAKFNAVPLRIFYDNPSWCDMMRRVVISGELDPGIEDPKFIEVAEWGMFKKLEQLDILATGRKIDLGPLTESMGDLKFLVLGDGVELEDYSCLRRFRSLQTFTMKNRHTQGRSKGFFIQRITDDMIDEWEEKRPPAPKPAAAVPPPAAPPSVEPPETKAVEAEPKKALEAEASESVPELTGEAAEVFDEGFVRKVLEFNAGLRKAVKAMDPEDPRSVFKTTFEQTEFFESLRRGTDLDADKLAEFLRKISKNTDEVRDGLRVARGFGGNINVCFGGDSSVRFYLHKDGSVDFDYVISDVDGSTYKVNNRTLEQFAERKKVGVAIVSPRAFKMRSPEGYVFFGNHDLEADYDFKVPLDGAANDGFDEFLRRGSEGVAEWARGRVAFLSRDALDKKIKRVEEKIGKYNAAADKKGDQIWADLVVDRWKDVAGFVLGCFDNNPEARKTDNFVALANVFKARSQIYLDALEARRRNLDGGDDEPPSGGGGEPGSDGEPMPPSAEPVKKMPPEPVAKPTPPASAVEAEASADEPRSFSMPPPYVADKQEHLSTPPPPVDEPSEEVSGEGPPGEDESVEDDLEGSIEGSPRDTEVKKLEELDVEEDGKTFEDLLVEAQDLVGEEVTVFGDGDFIRIVGRLSVDQVRELEGNDEVRDRISELDVDCRAEDSSSDLGIVGRFKGLKKLRIHAGVDGVDVGALAGLGNLEELSIFDAEPRDYKPLRGLDKLRQLYIRVESENLTRVYRNRKEVVEFLGEPEPAEDSFDEEDSVDEPAQAVEIPPEDVPKSIDQIFGAEFKQNIEQLKKSLVDNIESADLEDAESVVKAVFDQRNILKEWSPIDQEKINELWEKRKEVLPLSVDGFVIRESGMGGLRIIFPEESGHFRLTCPYSSSREMKWMTANHGLTVDKYKFDMGGIDASDGSFSARYDPNYGGFQMVSPSRLLVVGEIERKDKNIALKDMRQIQVPAGVEPVEGFKEDLQRSLGDVNSQISKFVDGRRLSELRHRRPHIAEIVEAYDGFFNKNLVDWPEDLGGLMPDRLEIHMREVFRRDNNLNSGNPNARVYAEVSRDRTQLFLDAMDARIQELEGGEGGSSRPLSMPGSVSEQAKAKKLVDEPTQDEPLILTRTEPDLDAADVEPPPVRDEDDEHMRSEVQAEMAAGGEGYDLPDDAAFPPARDNIDDILDAPMDLGLPDVKGSERFPDGIPGADDDSVEFHEFDAPDVGPDMGVSPLAEEEPFEEQVPGLGPDGGLLEPSGQEEKAEVAVELNSEELSKHIQDAAVSLSNAYDEVEDFEDYGQVEAMVGSQVKALRDVRGHLDKHIEGDELPGGITVKREGKKCFVRGMDAVKGFNLDGENAFVLTFDNGAHVVNQDSGVFTVKTAEGGAYLYRDGEVTKLPRVSDEDEESLDMSPDEFNAMLDGMAEELEDAGESADVSPPELPPISTDTVETQVEDMPSGREVQNARQKIIDEIGTLKGLSPMEAKSRFMILANRRTIAYCDEFLDAEEVRNFDADKANNKELKIYARKLNDRGQASNRCAEGRAFAMVVRVYCSNDLFRAEEKVPNRRVESIVLSDEAEVAISEVLAGVEATFEALKNLDLVEDHMRVRRLCNAQKHVLNRALHDVLKKDTGKGRSVAELSSGGRIDVDFIGSEFEIKMDRGDVKRIWFKFHNFTVEMADGSSFGNRDVDICGGGECGYDLRGISQHRDQDGEDGFKRIDISPLEKLEVELMSLEEGITVQHVDEGVWERGDAKIRKRIGVLQQDIAALEEFLEEGGDQGAEFPIDISRAMDFSGDVRQIYKELVREEKNHKGDEEAKILARAVVANKKNYIGYLQGYMTEEGDVSLDEVEDFDSLKELTPTQRRSIGPMRNERAIRERIDSLKGGKANLERFVEGSEGMSHLSEELVFDKQLEGEPERILTRLKAEGKHVKRSPEAIALAKALIENKQAAIDLLEEKLKPKKSGRVKLKTRKKKK